MSEATLKEMDEQLTALKRRRAELKRAMDREAKQQLPASSEDESECVEILQAIYNASCILTEVTRRQIIEKGAKPDKLGGDPQPG